MTLGRLGRYIFRNPKEKLRDHVIGYQSHVAWPHRAAVWADPIGLLAGYVLCDVACQLHGPWLEPAVLTTDSESNAMKSRRRQSCSVRSAGAAVIALAPLQLRGTMRHHGRHSASDGFFALSQRIAERCVEHGVLGCHRLSAIFTAKSSPVAVCPCEQDDRRSGRDVDDADKIRMSININYGSCIARKQGSTSCRRRRRARWTR